MGLSTEFCWENLSVSLERGLHASKQTALELKTDRRFGSPSYIIQVRNYAPYYTTSQLRIIYSRKNQ